VQVIQRLCDGFSPELGGLNEDNAVGALRCVAERLSEELQLVTYVLWLHDHAEDLEVKH